MIQKLEDHGECRQQKTGRPEVPGREQGGPPAQPGDSRRGQGAQLLPCRGPASRPSSPAPPRGHVTGGGAPDPPSLSFGGGGAAPGRRPPSSFKDPEAEAQRGRGHPVPALGLPPRLRFPGGPHRWASAAVPSETGAQNSQDSKGRPRGCRNPGKAQLAWEACRRSPWGLGAGQEIPCSEHLLPPPPHPHTLARESWLPTPHCGLCSSGGLSRPGPGQLRERLVVGLVGSPAQVTGAPSRRSSDQQPGPPSGSTHISRKIAKHLKDKWSVPCNPSPFS